MNADRERIAAGAALYQRRLQVTMMREPFQQMKLIPPETEMFSRYQTTLDNTLTKAIRALREAQELRRSLADAVGSD